MLQAPLHLSRAASTASASRFWSRLPLCAAPSSCASTASTARWSRLARTRCRGAAGAAMRTDWSACCAACGATGLALPFASLPRGCPGAGAQHLQLVQLALQHCGVVDFAHIHLVRRVLRVVVLRVLVDPDNHLQGVKRGAGQGSAVIWWLASTKKLGGKHLQRAPHQATGPTCLLLSMWACCRAAHSSIFSLGRPGQGRRPGGDGQQRQGGRVARGVSGRPADREQQLSGKPNPDRSCCNVKPTPL